MFAAGQPYSRPLRCHAAVGDPGDGAALGVFKALSGPLRRVHCPRVHPGGGVRGWGGMGVGRALSDSFPADPPPPSFLPRRANQTPRSSWVSGESGNKGKESHFLSRGRKEAESQPGRPASQPAPALGCSPWERMCWPPGQRFARTLRPPPNHF